MHVLYAVAGRGGCYRVRLMLGWLDAPYQIRRIHLLPGMSGQAPGGPDGAVCLSLADGREVWDQDAMLFALGEGSALAPRSAVETAEIVTWLRFADVLAAASGPGGVVASITALGRYLQTSRFLVGERYTIADIAVFAALIGAGEGCPGESGLAEPGGGVPEIAAWIDLIRQTQGFVDAGTAMAAA
ncbi:MAG: glutathione S-transferase C-terminal domain-containing protein [Pseudomonadota bacterium]